MSSGTQPDTDPGETMPWSHRGAIPHQHRVRESAIASMRSKLNLSTEKGKLSHINYYWHRMGEKRGLDGWNDHVPRDVIRQARESENASRLEDIKTIFHGHMDGAIPSTLVTDEWCQMFLITVESLSKMRMRMRISILRFDELRHFVKYANSFQDLDFRRSWICPFNPVFHIGFCDFTFPDHPTIQALPPPNIAECREELNDLEVKVGFEICLGSHREYSTWYSAYLYCRRFRNDSDPSLKDWAWRVVIFHAEGDSPTLFYGRNPRFDSIPEFPDCYSSWLDHLDLDQVRDDVMWLYGQNMERFLSSAIQSRWVH
ncbi:hypothetical protein N7447_009414 [Penicillium robsamsonii]|uniref:uncharacterized protein n=1 Tax=Penicillium robsamsonii TaxID=1792511 RepID=UPI0025488BF9|nr:uncharacterized protein N7447_009414 [Penicillium robsamsonii]KAJ5817181.1 hypothetical protein N7447_009414 [Penicillium robsamsonii]